MAFLKKTDRVEKRVEPSLSGDGSTAAPVAPARKGHDALRGQDPYSFTVAHRRLAWMFRISTLLNVGLFFCVIILAAAVSELVPLQKVQMGLVRIEPRTSQSEKVDPASLVRVLPIERQTPGFDIMMEAFVRRYVWMLLEIDPVSQDSRMREANLFSDTEWWKRFIKDRYKPIEEAIKTGLHRSIVVQSADRISERAGVSRYAVDIVQVDERDGVVVDRKALRAYLSVTTRPHTVRLEERFENPLGIRVLELVLKERTESQ